METEEKPEVSHLRCCIACLKDANEVHVEYSYDTNVTEIYNMLVQGEISQLGLTTLAICDFCKGTLQLIIEFQKQCLRSIDSLKAKLNFNPEIIFIKEEKLDFDDVVLKNNVETSFVEEDKEEQVDDDITKLSSDDDETVTEAQTTDDDDDDEEDEDSDNKQSEEENKTESEAPSVKNEDMKENGTNQTRKLRSKKEPKRHQCDQCNCSYLRPVELKRHVLKRHQGGSTCRYCRNVFVGKEEYEQHMREEAAKARPDPTLCCEMCGFTTKWKPGLRIHVKKYHSPDKPMLTCDVCGKSYKLRGEFKQHYIMKHVEKAFQCSECGKKFPFNAELQKHIRYYHILEDPNPVVECKYCHKSMKKNSLYQHVQIVHFGVKKYKCDVCSTTFSRAHVLDNHMRTHDPDRAKGARRQPLNHNDQSPKQTRRCSKPPKSIPCNQCDLSFKSKSDLTQHQLSTHLDKETLEKNYISCKFCTDKLRPGSMPMHVMTKHIDARRYKCDHCEKAFNHSRGLRMHMYTHTGERPFKCNICPNSYYGNDYLRNHFARAHDIQYTMEDIQRICGITPRKKQAVTT